MNTENSMNNDRFLTRVFDKQEKEMIYNCIFYVSDSDWRHTTITIRYPDDTYRIFDERVFKDRFVPMQCLGRKDKNKKLMYQKDIAKIGNVIIEIDYYDFEYQFVGVYQDDYQGLLSFENDNDEPEVLGNRYENLKLIDQITKYQDIYKGLK